eukprot:2135863-Pleurochrysis_carterae.AAC.1
MISLIYGPPSIRRCRLEGKLTFVQAHQRARGMSKQVRLGQGRLLRPNYAQAQVIKAEGKGGG